MPQSETILELEFISQLESLGYAFVNIHTEDDFTLNFKKQLEKFNAKELNNTPLSDKEFKKILNHLNKGNRFQKASNLRDRFLLTRDDETKTYIKFINTAKWCQNCYQVARQIRVKGAYGNRYDVTLLINGLPLVQIELKKRGMELKEAFNQINRYRIHSYPNTLFEYIQIFIISNGVNTKYFANNPDQNFEKTFFWTDEHNSKISNLSEFTDIFLEPCHLSKIISKYIVLSENKTMPMILRPYQYYAVEKIIERAENCNKNGYIWHTTGSGKTLTSFKAAQVLKDMPDIKKVLFVVDRKDLGVQTVEEFNKFAPGSVDSTENTKTLVSQLKDKDVKLIVTTIQKLDLAVTKDYHNQQFDYLKDEKVVIIFDECHRSQFGKTHANIKRFFNNAQLFGFTGTPILEKNCAGGVTTTAVFDKCLHKYLITDAISDGNALGFAVEYIGNYQKKEDGIFNENIEVDINKKEILESEKRIEKVVDYILSIHNKKTKNNMFNAILAVPSIDALKKYYDFFKKKKHDLKIAAIFTFQANEEKEDVLDVDVLAEGKENKLSRDYLEDCIKDYNETFQTNFSTDIFYDYYKDVQRKVKNRDIDLLIVVNMLLTGFDAQTLNTLYVDKNLRFHGLVQAYSRTNRIYDDRKPYGNIVCFRDLKANTDEALELFGNENAKDIVFKESYEKQKNKFIDAVSALKKFVPTLGDIDDLRSESDKIKFVKLFREVMKLESSLESYVEFNFNDVSIKEQEYFDYQSKYLDIYEKRKDPDSKTGGEINDIDFLLELTRQDIINYDYIVNLLSNLKKKENNPEEYHKDKEEFLAKLKRDMNYKPKEPYVKKFMELYLPYINKKDVKQEFDNFWEREKHGFIDKIANEENLDKEKFRGLINESVYTEKLPLGDSIIETLKEEPTIKRRVAIIKRIKEKIREFGAVFERW